jgi:hypothetical protein
MDVAHFVFTDDVIATLSQAAANRPQLRYRLEVLTARGAYPPDCPDAARVMMLRAHRAAWEAYLDAAASSKLLDEDLLSRLRGIDDTIFRSAMAECLACWYLAGTLGLRVEGRGEGRPGKLPDFRVIEASGEVTAEVKAPYQEPPQNRTWSGDGTDLLAATIDEANRQFAKERRNLLVLVPSLTIPVASIRYQAIKAFFGEYKIVVPIDREGGQPPAPIRTEFFPEGKLLKLWPENPRFTRISAVLVLEERATIRETDARETQALILHDALALHNPHCPDSLAPELFGTCPQFVKMDGGMGWSDGRALMK